MCSELCCLVEEVEEGRVFAVEDGGIWFSGMNSNVGSLAARVADRLRDEGYTVGSVQSDGADAFGGVFLPVEDAEPVDDSTHNRIVSPPGGDRREAETEVVQ